MCSAHTDTQASKGSIRTDGDLLLNISLFVGQSWVDKSFALRAHDLFTLTTDLQPVIY